MKPILLSVLLIFSCCFIPCSLIAQTPQSIKKDFNALFDKMDNVNLSADTDGKGYDVLDNISIAIVTKLNIIPKNHPLP